MPETDPLSLGAGQTRENYLNANAASNLGALSKYFGKYNMNPQPYMGTAAGVIDQSRMNSLADMRARTAESRVREDLHKQKLDLMWKQYKTQRKAQKQAQRQAYYGAIIGAGSQVAGSALQSANQPQQVPQTNTGYTNANPNANPNYGAYP